LSGILGKGDSGASLVGLILGKKNFRGEGPFLRFQCFPEFLTESYSEIKYGFDCLMPLSLL
jgi:hypothetical protein